MKCIHITKKGTQCLRESTNRSKKCWQHQIGGQAKMKKYSKLLKKHKNVKSLTVHSVYACMVRLRSL